MKFSIRNTNVYLLRFWISQLNVDTKGNINFVDFEYSGWDDPAKLVLDCIAPAMTNSADLRVLMSKIEIPRLNSQHLRAGVIWYISRLFYAGL